MIGTRFGRLCGVAALDPGIAPAGAQAQAVVSSEYVDICPAGAGGAEEGTDTLRGTVTSMDRVGQVVHVEIRLDARLDRRLEMRRAKIEGRGVAPGAEVELRWRPERTTIVLGRA